MNKQNRYRTAVILFIVGTLCVLAGTLLKGDADTVTGWLKAVSILGVGLDILAAIFFLWSGKEDEDQ